MEESFKVDKDYKEAFNQGYELAKDLGLKPDILKDVSAGNHRMQAMKDGMQQYQKDMELEKDMIPPMDMDSLDNDYIDLTPPDKDRGKDVDMDL